MRDQSPGCRGAANIDYLVLFVVIALGVAAGNLLSTFVTAQYAAYQVQEAAEQLSREMEASAARANAERAERDAARAAREREQRDQMRRVRGSGQLGQRLIRECEDWRRVAEATPTPTTKVQADRHCKKMEQYLDTGIWDPKLND